ncbi:MAG: hypothetical protein U9Q83_08105, partial [Bacteroidota bacterium]|nr:hypothetical protein [Bacteroidota bacterium]
MVRFIKFLMFLTFLIVLNIFGANAQNAGADTSVACNTIQMDASPAGGVWSSVSGVVTFSPNVNTANAQANNLQVGLNELIWTVGGVDDTVNVFYILADAGSDTTVCGDIIQLHGNNPAPGTGLWICSDGGVLFNDDTNPTATASNLPSGSGSVTFTWTIDVGGCQHSDDVLVANGKPDGTHAGTDDTTCTDNRFDLSASDPARFAGGTGTWSFSSGSGNFDDANVFDTRV